MRIYEEVKDISMLNPPQTYIDNLRTANLVIGLMAVLVLLFCLAIPRWHNWTVATRLGYMSLFLFVFVATYSTFEVKFLNTFLRVPMVTVALLWAILAALWPVYESRKLAKEEKKLR